MSVTAGIREEIAVFSAEFQVLFHKKMSSVGTELSTVENNIKGIFALIEEDSFVWGSNFKSFEKLNLRDIVTSNKYIINVNKNKGNTGGGDKSK